MESLWVLVKLEDLLADSSGPQLGWVLLDSGTEEMS